MKLPESYVAGREVAKPTAMGGFGQQMLERMGWQKGQGLGKDKQGRADPLGVKKKEDTRGLGDKLGWDWACDFASTAFDSALASVATATAAELSSSGSSDSDDTDCQRNADGTISSAAAHELKLARQLAKGHHTGRFAGRAGKLARVKEQEARLGRLAAGSAATAASHQQVAGSAKPSADAARAKTRAVVFEVPGHEAQLAGPAHLPERQPDTWWGRKRFVSSGWLGGTEEEVARKRQAFSEDTQVDLYNALQNTQSKVDCPPNVAMRHGKHTALHDRGIMTDDQCPSELTTVALIAAGTIARADRSEATGSNNVHAK